MGVHERLTGAQRAAKRRAKLRAQGLKLRQFWLPDMSNPEVQARIRAEVESLNALMERDKELLDDIEAMSAEVLDALPPYDWGPDGAPV